MQDQPVISFKALRRARSTLEDFTLTYLPLHGLDPLQGLLRHLDLLVFVEACIYEMDEANEALTAAGQLAPGHQFPAATVLERVLQQEGVWDEALAAELHLGTLYWQLERKVCAAMKAAPCLPQSDTTNTTLHPSMPATSPPAQLPPADNLYGSAAAGGGGALMQLWQLERTFVLQRQQHPQQQQLTGQNAAAASLPEVVAGDPPASGSGACAAEADHHQGHNPLQQDHEHSPPPALPSAQPAPQQPASTSAVVGPQAPLCFTDIIHAHEAKSFDYRVLHLLLHRIRGVPDDPTLLKFCQVDELLVDIGDDLTDYEDDVAANSFNVYRGYLHIFGPHEAPLCLAARLSDLEAQRSALLQQLSPEQQRHVLTRQKEAAKGQGADKWVFPRPILDEAAFRAELEAAEGVLYGMVARIDIMHANAVEDTAKEPGDTQQLGAACPGF